MSAWYLWDGVEQQGPMDLGALEIRIRSHANPAALLVWTQGLTEWKRPEDALGPAFAKISVPPPLPPRTLAPERPKRQNFIARHWRGEYPLWVSYWVVGILSNLAAVAAIILLSQFMVKQVSYVPLTLWIFFLVLWSSLGGLGLWQAVGVWRSATRRRIEHHAAGKRAFWPVMAKIAVCLGGLQLAGVLIKGAIPQIAEATRMAFLDDPAIPSYAIRAMNNGTEAEIAGGIKYGLTRDFEKLLEETPGVRVVHLDSLGGRIGEGKKLNALIRARQLDTYVETKCMSACTLAFAAGRQRMLMKGAVLGFHRGAFPGAKSEEVSAGIDRDIYAAAGFSQAFIERALNTDNSDMWKPTEAELLSARVVTKVSDGDEFAIGGRLGREDWDKALLKSAAVYSAVKQKYPTDYAEILDIFAREAAGGTPRAVVIGKARERFNGLIKTLLPLADDAVLVEFGRLAMEEYRALQAQDAAACYKFASGTAVDESVIRMIPRELTQREISIHQKIVLTAQKRDKAAGTDAAWTKIREALIRKGYSDDELQAMGSKTIPPSFYARYCAATVDMYSEIISLPAKDASLVLREMYADG
jgi:GYF domain 2